MKHSSGMQSASNLAKRVVYMRSMSIRHLSDGECLDNKGLHAADDDNDFMLRVVSTVTLS